MPHVVNIHANGHGSGLLQLLAEVKFVKIESRFGVYLSYDVGENAQLLKAGLHFLFLHELRSKTKSDKALFDLRFILSKWNENKNYCDVLRFSV